MADPVTPQPAPDASVELAKTVALLELKTKINTAAAETIQSGAASPWEVVALLVRSAAAITAAMPREVRREITKTVVHGFYKLVMAERRSMDAARPPAKRLH